MQDILTDAYDRRNLTEPKRLAYRFGWDAARCLADTQDAAWPFLWRGIVRRFPDADMAVCVEAFHTAWYRREVTMEAQHD